MTDLHTRFKSLDSLSTPNLWHDIEERAMAMQPTRRSNPWVLIAVTLLLALAIGGAVLVGSGIVKLPVSVDASVPPSSANPSSSAQESTVASSTPVANRAPGWTSTGSMVEAQPDHTATLLQDGRVLVAGGSDQTTGGKDGYLASAELYDPATASWTLTGAMLEARYLHTATLLLDGRVLVVGGGGYDGILASAELYDPASGTWTATGPMLEPRVGHTATLLPDGTVLVAGSWSGSSEGISSLASAELFDPETGSWTATASMTQARGTHVATLLQDGTVLVTAGTAATPSGEIYDPAAKTWSDTGPMVEGGTGQTATLLPDGTVLVTGQSAQLYDPTDQSWTPTGPMVTVDPVGYGHTATLLPDGTVLVVGGYDTNGDGVAAAELYDPSTAAWTATIGMIEGRTSHSATLLQNGTVLVAGGAKTIYADSLDGLLPSAELYDPGSGL